MSRLKYVFLSVENICSLVFLLAVFQRSARRLAPFRLAIKQTARRLRATTTFHASDRAVKNRPPAWVSTHTEQDLEKDLASYSPQVSESLRRFYKELNIDNNTSLTWNLFTNTFNSHKDGETDTLGALLRDLGINDIVCAKWLQEKLDFMTSRTQRDSHLSDIAQFDLAYRKLSGAALCARSKMCKSGHVRIACKALLCRYVAQQHITAKAREFKRFTSMTTARACHIWELAHIACL